MAKKETFYEQPVDRTPYGACAWVAFFAILLFGLVIYATVSITRGVSLRLSGFSFKKPSVALPSPTDITEQLRQQVNNQVEQQKNKAAEAVRQQAEEAAKKEAEKQKSNIQQYLP